MKKLLIGLSLFLIGLSTFAQTVDSSRFIRYPFVYGNRMARYWADSLLATKKIQFIPAGEYSEDFTIPKVASTLTLDTISADKTATFPTLSLSEKGVFSFVYNANSSAFTWNVAGTVIESNDGTTISTIGRGLHIFYWIGDRWIRQSASGGSGGTPDPYTGGYGILVDALTKVISYDSSITQTLELKGAGDSLWFEVDGVAGTKLYWPSGGGGGGNGIYGGSGSLPGDVTVTQADKLLMFNANAAAPAVQVINADQGGIDAQSENANGLSALSGNSDAILATSLNGSAAKLVTYPSTNNSVTSAVNIIAQSSAGSIASGFGSGIRFRAWDNGSGDSDGKTTNFIKSYWTDPATATRTSKFIITGLSSGTETDWFSLIPSYGLLGTDTIATRAYARSVGGGGSGTVSSVATGYGLLGGTITSTGTLRSDTNAVASLERVKKVADSLAIVLAPNLLVADAGAAGVGKAIWHSSGDTLKLSRLIGGTGMTITKGADSAITLSVSGADTATLSGYYAKNLGNNLGATLTLGTNDAQDFIFETQNTERMRINNANGQLLMGTTSGVGGYKMVVTNGAARFDRLYAIDFVTLAGSTRANRAFYSNGTDFTLPNTPNYVGTQTFWTFTNPNPSSSTGTGTHELVTIDKLVNRGTIPTWDGIERALKIGFTVTGSAGDLRAIEVLNGRTILKGIQTALVAKTAAYTATDDDCTITGDATSAAFQVTLPTAASRTGIIYRIKKIDASANAVTVGTTSSQTIDGSTTYSLGARWKYVAVQSDGSNWVIIANN